MREAPDGRPRGGGPRSFRRAGRVGPVAIAVALLLSAAALAAPAGRAVLSGAGMKTKLGVLCLGGAGDSPGLRTLLERGRLPILKVPAQDLARPDSVGLRFNKQNRKGILFVGIGASQKEMKGDRDPAEVLAKWLKDKDGDLKVLQEHRDAVDFLSFMPNMWEPKTVEQAQWYCRYIALAAPKVAELGFRPIVLQSGVGGLPIEPEILDAMAPALRTAKKYGGAWGSHGYTIDYTRDAGQESFYCLRYRRAYEHLRRAHPDVADLPMILMEGGVDKAGNPDKDGWQARGTKEKYQQWLEWLDGELLKDPQVLGIALFKIGDPNGWKSFDLEPVAPWLADHLDRKAR